MNNIEIITDILRGQNSKSRWSTFPVYENVITIWHWSTTYILNNWISGKQTQFDLLRKRNDDKYV